MMSPITSTIAEMIRRRPNDSPKTRVPMTAAKSTLDSRKEATVAIGARESAHNAME